MTGLRRYIVDDYAEIFRHGRLGRREFLRRLAMCAGGATLGVAGLDSKASSALAGNSPPAVSTRIDSNNNLVVNGKPFLFMRGGPEYIGWKASGYTAAQADAKWSQMVAAGVNVCLSHLGVVLPPGYFDPQFDNTATDLVLWQKYGVYTASGADTGPPNGNPWTAAGPGIVAASVQRWKSQPNILTWQFPGEWGMAFDPIKPTVDANIAALIRVCEAIRGADPAHPVVSSLSVQQDETRDSFDRWCNSRGIQLPAWEMSLPRSNPADSISATGKWLMLMNDRVLAQGPNGLGWIPCVNFGAIGELVGTIDRVPTKAEIFRYVMLQVAFNCRAFDVYWGPVLRSGGGKFLSALTANSRIGLVSDNAGGNDTRTCSMEGISASTGLPVNENLTLKGTTTVLSANTYSKLTYVRPSPLGGFGYDANNTITITRVLPDGAIIGTIPGPPVPERGIFAPGDDGLPGGFLDTWNSTWEVMTTVKSMESIILAPGNWLQIATTPAFQGANFRRGFPPAAGIYAVKKTVSGVTYVIAINVQEDAKTHHELPVRAAKIDLGKTIRRATHLFDHTGAGPSTNPPVSFSGSVITQDFEPMQARVYKLSEGV